MIVPKVPPGHVRALVECPRDEALKAAAHESLAGRHPMRSMLSFAGDGDKLPSDFTIDPTVGAISIGRGAQHEGAENLQRFLLPEESERFLVSGFVNMSGRDSVPEYLVKNGQKYLIHSNPLIGGLLQLPPCLPTCGTNSASKPSRTTD
jgi:hypothetical protein